MPKNFAKRDFSTISTLSYLSPCIVPECGSAATTRVNGSPSVFPILPVSLSIHKVSYAQKQIHHKHTFHSTNDGSTPTIYFHSLPTTIVPINTYSLSTTLLQPERPCWPVPKLYARHNPETYPCSPYLLPNKKLKTKFSFYFSILILFRTFVCHQKLAYITTTPIPIEKTDIMKTLERLVAEKLLKISSRKLQPALPFTWASVGNSPNFTPTIANTFVSAIRSFIKIELCRLILEKFENIDAIAGVATGAIAQGALIAEATGTALCLRTFGAQRSRSRKSH